MTPATATPPTSIARIREDEAGSYTSWSTRPSIPAGASLGPFAATLQALEELTDGWDSYGALAPARNALATAWTVASSLSLLGSVPQLFPTRRGGAQLEWHTPRASLEWEIDPSGGTGVFIFDNHATGEKFDGDLPADSYQLDLALRQVYADP